MGGTINEQFPVGVTKEMVLEQQIRDLKAELDRHRQSAGLVLDKNRKHRDKLIAERDQLAADNARLRAALQPFADRIKQYPPWMWTAMIEREKEGIITGGFTVGGEAVTHMPAMLLVQAEEALAATPAQSLAAHDEALLREVAKLMDPDGGCYEALMAEADRIERAGGAEEVA